MPGLPPKVYIYARELDTGRVRTLRVGSGTSRVVAGTVIPSFVRIDVMLVGNR